MNRPLTLSKALKANRLADFILQEEERGVLSVNRRDLDAALASLIKSPQSEDQTSPAPSSDGLRGK